MRSCCVLLSSSVICPCTHKLHNTRAHFYCLSSMSVIVYMCFRHCHLITSAVTTSAANFRKAAADELNSHAFSSSRDELLASD